MSEIVPVQNYDEIDEINVKSMRCLNCESINEPHLRAIFEINETHKDEFYGEKFIVHSICASCLEDVIQERNKNANILENKIKNILKEKLN